MTKTISKSVVKPRSLRIIDYRRTPIPIEDAVILSNLASRWKWIARDPDGNLGIYARKPFRNSKGKWAVDYMGDRRPDAMPFPYRNLFQYIKSTDDEPVNIDRLLKNNLMAMEAAEKTGGKY